MSLASPKNEPTKEQSPRRARRTSGEVRERILQAASDLFEENGFSGTSTAAIARKAGVAEALLFSNFGTKDKLFTASIFLPLDRELISFCEAGLLGGPKTDDERLAATHDYIDRLEHFLDRNARKFQTLLVQQLFEKPRGELDDINGIQGYFETASAMTARGRDGDPVIEPGMIARLTFGAIFSAVVLRKWLFPQDYASKAETFEALREFIVAGMSVNDRT